MPVPYRVHLQQNVTPQNEPIHDDQVLNNAGGYVYQITPMQQLERFLTIGSIGGTHYVSERKLTVECIRVVKECLDTDYTATLDKIVGISYEGRAPSNDHAVAALAIAASHSNIEVRKLALHHLSKVCRIPTHLFHFMAIVKELRGMGRTLKTAIQQWYTDKSADSFAFHALKYQKRDKWSHRDVLRLVRPKMPTQDHRAVQRWIYNGEIDPNIDVMSQIYAHHILHTARLNVKQAVKLIEAFKLTFEMLPTELLNHKEVWQSLIPHMGMTALIRNLGKMTSIDMFLNSNMQSLVADTLTDAVRLKKERVHPINILLALKTYAQGHGMKGSLKWNPDAKIIDALDEAFYLSFGSVESTGKRILLALDVSGSMTSPAAGLPLSCREVTAAMAMLTARTEQKYHVVGFCRSLVPLSISPRQRLDDIVATISYLPFGETDCAQPMIYAGTNGMEVDAFVVYTDNETWAGRIHPSQALRMYREASGINAKLIVQAITPTKFSIADPQDAGMLDLSGFDSATPQVMNWFITKE